MLPVLPNKDGISKWRSVDFRGIRHVLGAQTGDIWDCYGVTPDDYPVLRSVDWTKYKYDANSKGVYGSFQYGVNEDQRVYVNGDGVYLMDTLVFSATFTEKQRIVAFNNFALLFPAKLWVRTDVKGFVASAGALPQEAEYGDVYAVGSAAPYDCKYWDGSAWADLDNAVGAMAHSESASCTFIDGEYAGEAAEGNTLHRTGGTWSGFAVGDAVTISGSSESDNNKTIIIREISDDKKDLRFYEHSFTVTATAETITVAREVPDIEWACVNENRVWGCKGQHIYASKLGDFKNWNAFDGIASDSYAVDVMAEGDFTGCVSFLGYPVFFKRNAIYKVYGNRPSNYEVMGSASTGTVNGDTLAIASETLFYLSTRGIMAYNGGIPSLVSGDLGDLITGSADAWGATDGRKYYFGYPVTGETPVYEYDPEKGMWHKQVYPATISYGYRGHKSAVFVTSAGYRYGDITAAGSLSNAFMVEFAEMDMGDFASKYPTRVWFRMENANAVTVTVKYNSGSFETAFTIPTEGKSARNFPVPIRRCDRFALKLTGTGQMRLYAMEAELRTERTNRKGG